MACRAVPPPLRIAIGLSGGVDSAVSALVLRRCVHTTRDVAALRCFGLATVPPPSLTALHAAVVAATPLTRLLPDSMRHAETFSTGGDDASAVAYAPFFMRNWHDADGGPHGWCVRAQRDYDDAQAVARAVGLLSPTTALPVVDSADTYAEKCFQQMLRAYAAGHTLNVDVLCNEHVKFGAVARALKVTQAMPFAEDICEGSCAPPPQLQTLLATGHYARTWALPRVAVPTTPPSQLLLQPCSAGCDLNDQTHFLARVPPSALAGVLFPLGHLFRCKADVRALAARAFDAVGDVAHISHKQTSTGICFVGPPPPPSSSLSSPSASFTHDKADVKRQTKRAAVPSPQVSCKAHFANFLNDFLPPPPPAASEFLGSTPSPQTLLTIFRDVDTKAEKALVNAAQTFGGLQADYPHFLPAYAVTLGQRLRLADARTTPQKSRRRSSTAKQPAEESRTQNYYVARKVYCPPSQNSTAAPHAVRLLAEVHVVDRWDHPALFAAQVPVTSLRWWLPLDAVQRASSFTDATAQFTTPCLCAVRHQMTPQPAVLQWTHAALQQGEQEDCTPLHLPSCTVCFDTPVRAAAAGQAVVLYAAVPDIVRLLSAPRESAADTMVPRTAADAALVVIGVGWVAAAEEGK